MAGSVELTIDQQCHLRDLVRQLLPIQPMETSETCVDFGGDFRWFFTAMGELRTGDWQADLVAGRATNPRTIEVIRTVRPYVGDLRVWVERSPWIGRLLELTAADNPYLKLESRLRSGISGFINIRERFLRGVTEEGYGFEVFRADYCRKLAHLLERAAVEMVGIGIPLPVMRRLGTFEPGLLEGYAAEG